MVNHFGFLCSDCAATPGGDYFVAIKRKCSVITDGSGIPAGIFPFRIFCSQSLRCILNNLEFILPCNIHDFRHVCHVAEYMYNYKCSDCFSAFMDKLISLYRALLFAESAQFHGVHAQRVIAIHKNRLGKLIFNRIDRCNKCQSGNNNHVPRSDATIHQCHMQCRCSALTGSNIMCTDEIRQSLLKLRNKGSPRRNPALRQRFINIFSFIALKIRYR